MDPTRTPDYAPVLRMLERLEDRLSADLRAMRTDLQQVTPRHETTALDGRLTARLDDLSERLDYLERRTIWPILAPLLLTAMLWLLTHWERLWTPLTR